MSDIEPTEAADILLSIITAVQRGDLEASTPQAKAALRRLQGAELALRSLAEASQPTADAVDDNASEAH